MSRGRRSAQHDDAVPADERPTQRAELLEHLHAAGRAQSAATIMFHTAVAATIGLSPTDEKALDLLGRFGPVTASDLAERTGLARASVTALVDRLERKGLARRVANPADGRSVLIESVADPSAPIGRLFAEWARSLDELYAGYSDSELELILRFMLDATERQRQATAKITEATGA